MRASDSINAFIAYCTINFQRFFDGIAWSVRTVLTSIEALFVGIPWPITAMLFILTAWRVAGRRVAIFVGLSLLYLGMFNFWVNAMSTFSLVFAAVFISVSFGIPTGILCAKSAGVYRVVRPALDVMQTLPSFVYLIPAIAFFSVGKTPGVLATFIFSCPAIIRLTALGIQQVPHSVKEAALAFGASPLQLLFKAELPLALPSIMTGVNQTYPAQYLNERHCGTYRRGWSRLRCPLRSPECGGRSRRVSWHRDCIVRNDHRPHHSRRAKVGSGLISNTGRSIQTVISRVALSTSCRATSAIPETCFLDAFSSNP